MNFSVVVRGCFHRLSRRYCVSGNERIESERIFVGYLGEQLVQGGIKFGEPLEPRPMGSAACAALNRLFRFTCNPNMDVIGMRQAVARLQHHGLCVPQEFEVCLLGGGVFHQTCLYIPTHEQELHIYLSVRQQSPKEQPLTLHVEKAVRVVGELHEPICTEWKETRVFARDPRRRRDEEKKVDVATGSMGIVPRDLSAGLGAEVTDDERGTSGHFLFDDSCRPFDGANKARQTVIHGRPGSEALIAYAFFRKLRGVREYPVVGHADRSLKSRGERRGRSHAARGEECEPRCYVGEYAMGERT
jgi:hypothetical protein